MNINKWLNGLVHRCMSVFPIHTLHATRKNAWQNQQCQVLFLIIWRKKNHCVISLKHGVNITWPRWKFHGNVSLQLIHTYRWIKRLTMRFLVLETSFSLANVKMIPYLNRVFVYPVWKPPVQNTLRAYTGLYNFSALGHSIDTCQASPVIYSNVSWGLFVICSPYWPTS